ncbi:MAG: hypothetical protein ACR2NZ_05095 [Rubripirellula sp.]
MTMTTKAIAAALTAVAMLALCPQQSDAQVPIAYTTVQSTTPAVVGYQYEPRGLLGLRGVYRPVVVPGATVNYVAPVAVSTPVPMAAPVPVVRTRVVVPPPVTYSAPVAYVAPVTVAPTVVVPATPLPPAPLPPVLSPAVPSPFVPTTVVLPMNL